MIQRGPETSFWFAVKFFWSWMKITRAWNDSSLNLRAVIFSASMLYFKSFFQFLFSKKVQRTRFLSEASKDKKWATLGLEKRRKRLKLFVQFSPNNSTSNHLLFLIFHTQLGVQKISKKILKKPWIYSISIRQGQYIKEPQNNFEEKKYVEFE